MQTQKQKNDNLSSQLLGWTSVNHTNTNLFKQEYKYKHLNIHIDGNFLSGNIINGKEEVVDTITILFSSELQAGSLVIVCYDSASGQIHHRNMEELSDPMAADVYSYIFKELKIKPITIN